MIITDTPTTLIDILVQNGLSVDRNNVVQISLLRGKKVYKFTLDELLDVTTPKVYLKAEDRVIIDILQYKENKVFILGGVSPQIFKINPTQRETLADVLFTAGGPQALPL